ncbi:MAG TPA: hypothetical protein VHE30_25550 [Polyangiaceae bacterium]|nr:hypothetical protein [Polyangiaceae bacterium]
MAVKALAWLLVPALGLAELGGHFYFSTRAPGLDEWRAVTPTVRKLRTRDELVVVAPDWAEPNARYAFGDELMPLSAVARADESTFPRAIEVSILSASAPELRGFKIVSEARSGKFRLRVLENPAPAKVLYDFVEHVRDAKVAELRGGAETPCPLNAHAHPTAGGLHGDPAFPALRHECGGADSHFVGVTVVEDENWRGRRCLWAMPVPGATLAVRFDAVPLGKTIRGYGTLPQWTERELRGAPVEVTVLVAGSPVGTYVHRDGDGWKRFEFPVAAPSPSDVEFRISSPRGGRDRQFCFQADSR